MFRLIQVQVVLGAQIMLLTVISSPKSSTESNTTEKVWAFMPLPICGRPLWEVQQLALDWVLMSCGMLTTIALLLLRTLRVSVGGASQLTSSSQGQLVCVEQVWTKTIMRDECAI